LRQKLLNGLTHKERMEALFSMEMEFSAHQKDMELGKF
jgi:hypothetical protein